MMEWTTERPTKRGWYWAWNKIADGPFVVFLTNGDNGLAWFPEYDAWQPEYNLSNIGTHWVGPLAEPDAPKES